MAVNLNPVKINFWTPVLFSKNFLSQKKPLAKALIVFGSFADLYVYSGKYYIKASTMQRKTIKGHVWKTTLKVTSFVLSALILPALLIAKAIYKNWAKHLLSKQQVKQEEIKPPILSKEQQEVLDRMNQDFVNQMLHLKDQTDADYASAYNNLKSIAETVQKLDENENNYLTCKDKQLVVFQTKKMKKIEKKNGAAIDEALQIVFDGVEHALNKKIMAVDIKGEMITLYDILSKIGKRQMGSILHRHKLEGLQEDVLNKITQKIGLFESELRNLPLPGKEKEENKKLSKISFTIPFSNDLLENILTKKANELPAGETRQEYRKTFPLLTNTALINGLPFLKMTPITLLQNMTTLMSDGCTPLSVKYNLLNIFEALMQSSHYDEELSSADFSKEVHTFAQAVENLKGPGSDIIQQKKNHNVEDLYQSKLPLIKIIKKEEQELPKPTSVIDEHKIKEIKAAIVNGNKKEMKKLAKTFAQSLPAFYAPYMQKISFKDLLSDSQKAIRLIADATNAVTSEAFGYDFRDALYEEVVFENREEMKENYKKFVCYVIKESFQIGDFQTTGHLLAYTDAPEKITALFDAQKNYKAYRSYEKKFKQEKMVPFLTPLLTNIASTVEADAVISTVERIHLLNRSYEKLESYQKKSQIHLALA